MVRVPPGERVLTVLVSFPLPRPTTNPYIVMLGQVLRDERGLRLVYFSWKSALVGRYDVFHAHWPEILVAGKPGLKLFGRQLLFLLMLTRLWVCRIPVVRTLHNLRPHDSGGRVEKYLLRLLDRRTVGWIRLNPFTETPDEARTATILHGHYIDWFGGYEQPSAMPGRLVFAGLIRDYKNIPALIGAFGDLVDPAAELRIVGSPSNDQLAGDITELAASDSRVSTSFGYLSDEELALEIGRAELVVLPYAEMHNSGAALLALSMRRPILTPDNEVTRTLAGEMGDGWVHRYSGALTAAGISAAITDLRTNPPQSAPQLAARDWDSAGFAHLGTYRAAQQFRRRAGRQPGRTARGRVGSPERDAANSSS
jgi:beta-1,4-mannosyltransferase